MSEHTLFHIVFLSQILLISAYFPRKILGRMKYVFETYPPSTYPKLYPKHIEYYEKGRRNYRILNLSILLAGLVLLAVLLGYSRSGEWDHAIAMWFYIVQLVPLMLLDLAAVKEFKLMRSASSGSARTAVLRPRNLFNFVSPAFFGAAVFTYFSFILLVLYFVQNPFDGFGGILNIAIVSAMNLVIAAIIFRKIYGKKLDPHQSHDDRMRKIGRLAKILIFISIAATLFGAINLVVAALDSRSLQPVLHSVYYQLLAVACCMTYYRIGDTNFDVYKENGMAT